MREERDGRERGGMDKREKGEIEERGSRLSECESKRKNEMEKHAHRRTFTYKSLNTMAI